MVSKEIVVSMVTPVSGSISLVTAQSVFLLRNKFIVHTIVGVVNAIVHVAVVIVLNAFLLIAVPFVDAIMLLLLLPIDSVFPPVIISI